MNDTSEQNPVRIPVACTLDGSERAEREAAIRATFEQTERIDELANGIRARFPGDAGTLRRLMDLMGIERACCRFLRFRLDAEPGMGPVHLTVTGPEGTKELLAAWVSEGEA